VNQTPMMAKIARTEPLRASKWRNHYTECISCHIHTRGVC